MCQTWGFLLALLSAVVMSSAGCGKRDRELAPLAGKVTWEGEPLRFGAVVFEHEYGQPATAAIQPDGTFELVTRGEATGTVVGTRRVRIACYEGQNPTRRSGSDGPAELGRSLIPERYTSFETSGLAVEVRPGTNEPVVLNLNK
ncbi:MAG: hypothetical protein U1E05_07920 [Patescibacteria group bacterium]|nr:hypothetical protein [Patescibacteria group bacterium]